MMNTNELVALPKYKWVAVLLCGSEIVMISETEAAGIPSIVFENNTGQTVSFDLVQVFCLALGIFLKPMFLPSFQMAEVIPQGCKMPHKNTSSTCPHCASTNTRKNGSSAKGQKWRCNDCGKNWTDNPAKRGPKKLGKKKLTASEKYHRWKATLTSEQWQEYLQRKRLSKKQKKIEKGIDNEIG